MQTTLRSRPYRTAAERAQIVAAFERSGLSQRAFALQHGIAPSNLPRWLSQSRSDPGHDDLCALVEVPNLLPPGPAAGAYRLHFPKGLILELARGFEPGEVRVLAQLVQSL